MIRSSHFSVCLVSLCLAVIAPVDVAQAEDEDLTASVYLVFDPETGEFMEVNDPDRTRQNHDAQDPADVTLAALGASNSGSVLGPKSSLLAGLAIGAALLAAIIAWRRFSRIRSAGAAASNGKLSWRWRSG